jgi:hypothetical protein
MITHTSRFSCIRHSTVASSSYLAPPFVDLSDIPMSFTVLSESGNRCATPRTRTLTNGFGIHRATNYTREANKNIQRPNGVKTLGYFFLSFPISRASDSVPFPNLQPFTLECFCIPYEIRTRASA